MHSHKIIEVADELQNRIELGTGLSEETLGTVKDAKRVLDAMYEITKNIEFLLDGEISEEIFNTRFKEIERRF